MGRPICQHFVQSAGGPSADGTVSSGYILTTLPKFCPICILDKMFPDGPFRLPSEHNVCRWAVPSADRPIWLHFAQSADGMSADGMSHLPTFCPICRHFAQSAEILSNLHTGPNVPSWALPLIKCWQMGRPICRWDASPDGLEHKHILVYIFAEQTEEQIS